MNTKDIQAGENGHGNSSFVPFPHKFKTLGGLQTFYLVGYCRTNHLGFSNRDTSLCPERPRCSVAKKMAAVSLIN
jgi:hypothetical protein